MSARSVGVGVAPEACPLRLYIYLELAVKFEKMNVCTDLSPRVFDASRTTYT
jgi:hypothetical protein